MTTLWQCDRCGAVWDTLDAIALLEIEFNGTTELHSCPDHLPDDWYPSEDAPDIDPLITADEWVTLEGA